MTTFWAMVTGFIVGDIIRRHIIFRAEDAFHNWRYKKEYGKRDNEIVNYSTLLQSIKMAEDK